MMSANKNPRLKLKQDLLNKLSAAQHQKSKGDKGKPLKQVIAEIRRTIHHSYKSAEHIKL